MTGSAGTAPDDDNSTGLADALALLAAAGCSHVWLNGSFVTAKDEPGDFDAIWGRESAWPREKPW